MRCYARVVGMRTDFGQSHTIRTERLCTTLSVANLHVAGLASESMTETLYAAVSAPALAEGLTGQSVPRVNGHAPSSSFSAAVLVIERRKSRSRPAVARSLR